MDWRHQLPPPLEAELLPGATELEEIQIGDAFAGSVTNVGIYGVFVDVGAASWPDSATNQECKQRRLRRFGRKLTKDNQVWLLFG